MLELGCLYEEKRFAWFTVIDLESQDHDNSERLLVFWSLSLFLILSLPLCLPPPLCPSVSFPPSLLLQKSRISLTENDRHNSERVKL